MVEPWLRGTLIEFDAVRRQVLHALELAEEDAEQWCACLSNVALNLRPCGVAPVAYHLRHIARSLDRLLTYAEGGQLNAWQRGLLNSELDKKAQTSEVMDEFRRGVRSARERVERIVPGQMEELRGVGKERLPSTVGGLLVHCAEHTQRHIGQAITTAQIVSRLPDLPNAR